MRTYAEKGERLNFLHLVPRFRPYVAEDMSTVGGPLGGHDKNGSICFGAGLILGYLILSMKTVLNQIKVMDQYSTCRVEPSMSEYRKNSRR